MTDQPALPRYERHGDVAVVTLDDGKANVFSNAALAALEGHLDRVGSDGARALVITGRPGRFSAGFDLSEMTASTEAMRALVARGGRWWLRLYGLGLPTVAACTGHALAGGAITLLACDVRIGADVAAKIGLNEVSIGMPMPVFGVELARERLVPSAFGPSVLAGRVHDPAGAVAAGFLDRTVPPDDLHQAAMAEATALAALRTGAYARTKVNARGEFVARVGATIDDDLATIDGPDV